MQDVGWHKSRSFWESCSFAWKGILHVFRTERNMRIQVIIYAVATILSIFLGLTPTQQVLIVLAATLIVVLEMINSVVEDVADLVQPMYHEQVRILKDVIAGAVMVASLSAILIAVLLFGPPIAALFVY